MEYNGNNNTFFNGVGQQQGSAPYGSNTHVEKNLELLLKYIATGQTVLTDEAYEHMHAIMRERSHVMKPQATRGPDMDDQQPQAMHSQFEDMTPQHVVKQTALLECPKSMVGRVIGKAGGTIKALQEYTGAMIQIDQSTDPTRVTLAGSPQSLQLAISMVSDIIKGKFKEFAMLRQIANAKEMVHQHGGNGMGTQPVYVQGYGFLPPAQSMGGNLPSHDVRDVESHGFYSAGLQQQQQQQYTTTSPNHSIVLSQLMQLAAVNQQQPQRVPAGDGFLSDHAGLTGQYPCVNATFPTQNSGMCTGYIEKATSLGGTSTTDSLF
jgi:rRNA processing protein Krr1/Pno1